MNETEGECCLRRKLKGIRAILDNWDKKTGKILSLSSNICNSKAIIC